MAARPGEASATEEAVEWPRVKVWLFRYVLVVAILAFCNRSLPTPFLPLVLKEDFHQPFVAIGLAMAMYPAAALVASSWASRVALGSASIVQVHTRALLVMACATIVFASSEELLRLFGRGPALAFVICFRALQGVSSALYLSSNTTLITRFFTGDVPYVLGMVEVAVGTGSQLGRMLGGFLFDLGGFSCPFCALAAVQVAWSLVGFTFNDTGEDSGFSSRPVLRKQVDKLPWSAFVTRRSVVALAGVLANYFIVGFLDTTLPEHLEQHIGPISVSILSLLMSIRSASYLLFSYLFAQAMHKDLLSYERMIALGAICTLVGLALVSPVTPIERALAWLEMDAALLARVHWAIQITAMIVMPSGLAALFIPALPLLQSEVRHLGGQAIEQVAQLFIAAMSLGEAIGPIIGGAAVARLGFATTTVIFSTPLWLVLIGSLATYDREAARDRFRASGGAAAGLLEEAAGGGEGATAELLPPILERQISRQGSWPHIVDGESAFQWRRLAFALQQDLGPPGSAPSVSWRRTYSPVAKRQKPWATAPSSSFRRSYSGRRPART